MYINIFILIEHHTQIVMSESRVFNPRTKYVRRGVADQGSEAPEGSFSNTIY